MCEINFGEDSRNFEYENFQLKKLVNVCYI
jgi:hypothetical protein